MLILLQYGKVVVPITVPSKNMTLELVKLSIVASNSVEHTLTQNNFVLTSYIDQILVSA